MRFWIICFLGILCIDCKAQFFQINGTAEDLGQNCYLLTNAQTGQAGSIWRIETINLNQGFQIKFKMNLGCTDSNGADGIVFGFQNQDTSVGTSGQGMGFGGVSPSVGFEFDTYQNGGLGDPAFDHTGLMLNGNMDHGSNLSGPFPISSSNNNVEDCMFHNVDIFWDSNTQNLAMYYDCEERINYNINLIDAVFGGDPEVFWGFTSATGALFNEQQICIDFVSNTLSDAEICAGEEVQLEATGGVDYEWSPSDGLSDPNISNPIASPQITTVYTVTITDDCGFISAEMATVTVIPQPLVDLGGVINECNGTTLSLDATFPGATYSWSTGSTDAIISVDTQGAYEVTVSVGDCAYVDEVLVFFEEAPSLEIDSLICGNSLLFEGTNILVGESGAFNYPTGICDSTLTINVLGTAWNIETATSPTCIGFESGSLTVTSAIGGEEPLSFSLDGNNFFESNFFEGLPAGSGTVHIQDINDCLATSSYIIEGQDCGPDCYLGMPNAFSPNGDGSNDIYFPKTDCELITFKIFNRWGKLIYESADASEGWDGFFQGTAQPLATYTWLIVVRDSGKDIRREEKGNLTLLR